MKPLWGSVIMLYGEDHRNPKIPSLRGESGAFLLESERPDLCLLSKIEENPDNVYIRIDEGYKSVKKDLASRFFLKYNFIQVNAIIKLNEKIFILKKSLRLCCTIIFISFKSVN